MIQVDEHIFQIENQQRALLAKMKNIKRLHRPFRDASTNAIISGS